MRAGPAQLEADVRLGTHAETGPVFLAGADRSGKTLVRWMLSSLPTLAVSRRTEMWPRFFGRFGDLDRSDNLDRCLRAMSRRNQIQVLEPDTERIRREFQRGPQTYGRLFAIFHEQYAERSGKSRWADQTPLIERFADEIMAAYPGAKFVHMIRDPRDAHHAVLERGTRRRGAIGTTTYTWATSAKLAELNLRRYPENYTVVRYESLVDEPTATMRAVCSFLGETFMPSMLMLEGARRYDHERRAAGSRTPISSAHVGTFRGKLRPHEVAFIQLVTGRRMRRLSYDTEPSDVTSDLRSAVQVWPIALAQMGVLGLENSVDAARRRATVARKL
ncbi:MAG: sulfotransferase [Actinobacteria bacterium]|nr:sulfotransferase [Actinomycetota bacterium]